MFDGFENQWTVALPSRRLTARRPSSVQVAGERLALFRQPDGAVGALLDRCPHRGVQLSLGKVAADGCLECPFHGWRFDRSGANRHVPLNPDAKRERLFARSVPALELMGFVWVYTAAVDRAPAPPQAPPSLGDPALTRVLVERTWACHWSRAMENMLDSPHLPFVHRTTIGRAMARRMTERSRMVVQWEDTPWGGRQRSQLDGQGQGAHLDFYRPNMMSLHIPIPGKRLEILALVVPLEARTTRLYVVGARDFLRWRALNPLFGWLNGRIADQDQAVVESSQPPEVPRPQDELSVATDRATLAFRRWYFTELRAAQVRPGVGLTLPRG